MAAILSLTALLDSLATPLVAGWLLKITLLTGIACACVALLRRAQPALRHAVAAGSLLAVVLLPAASKLLPAVSIPVLQSEKSVEVPAPAPVDDPAPVVIEYVPATHYSVAAIDAPGAASASQPESPSFASRVAAFAGDAVQSRTNWVRLAVVLWAMVAAALFARLATAFLRANHLVRGAMQIDDEAIDVAVDRACRVLRVRRRPAVMISRSISIPMVVGVLRPRVILPATAATWSHQRLGVVLLHEIAHIKRRDPVWMLVARAVNSVFWFHPFVRMLALHVRRDSELACDDLVLRAGVRASDYAGHLVSIASMSARRDPVFAATLAFAARSTLEQRVTSILSARRRAASTRAVAAAAAMSAVVFIGIAVAHPTDRTRAEYEEGKQEYQAGKADFELQRSIQQAMMAAEQAQVTVPECTEAAAQAAQIAPVVVQSAYSYADAGDGKMHIHFANNDDDDEEEGEEWYDRAQKHYQRERWEQAGRAYENAARFGYNRATAYYNAGCSFALANMTDPAMENLEAAFDEGFDDLDMYASDSDLNSLRDTSRFKKLMETVRKSDDGDQRLRQASRQYERLSKGKNIDEGEWSGVGIDLMRAGDYDRAAAAFDNEFKLSKNTSENALYNKACARALGGKSDEALKLLEQAIAVGSVDAEHMEKDPDLLSLHKSKKFDELVKLAEDLELNTGLDNQVWHISGNKVKRISYADEVKEWKKSVAHFQEMANRHPTFGRAWFNLGYAQLKAEEPKSATTSFQKSLDLGYKPPVMMYNLACSTALSGETDAAFVWLDKSEKAGFEVWNYARWDEDLDPLRADPRYKELKKRWKEKEREHHDDHDNEHDQTIHIDID